LLLETSDFKIAAKLAKAFLDRRRH